MCNTGEPKFFVNSGDDNFSDRQKNIFSKLDAVVKDNESLVNPKRNEEFFTDSVKPSRSPNKRQKLETKHFRGKESIFKRPEAPPPSRINRNIPDHKRNPHKWTKYSLSDVSLEDMSDQTNTAAALSFLQELKSRKEILESMDVDDSKTQIVFKRPTIHENRTDLNCNKPKIFKTRTTAFPTEEEGPCFQNSKLIMPEYVVGQKKTVKKNCQKNTGSVDCAVKEIKLDHLTEEDYDE